MKLNTQLLARMGVLIALGVAGSYMSAIPMFGAKLNPVQAATNVVAGAILGPWYAGVVALFIALFRNLLGTGTPLAFPGSIFGAMLAGWAFQATRSRLLTMAGEVVGTGLVGAVVSYPIAAQLLGNARAAAGGMFFYVVPFGSASLFGAILGGVVLLALSRTPILEQTVSEG